MKDGLRENFVVWDRKARRRYGNRESGVPLRQSQTGLERQALVRSGGWHEGRLQNGLGCLLRRSRAIPARTGGGNHLGSQRRKFRRRPLFRAEQARRHSLGLADRLHPGITPTAQAITALWCLTGNLEVPGGNVIARNAFECVSYALPGAEGVIKLASKEVDQKRIGIDKYGPFRKFIWRAQTDTVLDQIFTGKPYPIKALWMQTGNLIAGIGFEPKKWREALKKLDFVVAVDLFMTPTTQFADIVLPAATFLEKDSVRSWWVPLQTINKAISVDGCKPDVEINFELARRFDPNLRWKTVEDLFDDILQKSGMTFKELQEKHWAIPPEGNSSAPYHRHEKGLLRKDGQPGFETPSGKVELYSILREEWGLEPLPHYEEPPFTPVSRPDLGKRVSADSFHRPALVCLFQRRAPEYPVAARTRSGPDRRDPPGHGQSLDIGDGEWVWVENWLGRQQFKAKFTLAVLPQMVMAAHGWWFPEEEGAEPSLFGAWKSNINQLIPMGSQGKDGLGAPIKNLLCKVYKVQDGMNGMDKKKPEYGLLIDYEYCTGCHSCEVACAQEYKHKAGVRGIKVFEVEQKLPDGACTWPISLSRPKPAFCARISQRKGSSRPA